MATSWRQSLEVITEIKSEINELGLKTKYGSHYWRHTVITNIYVKLQPYFLIAFSSRRNVLDLSRPQCQHKEQALKTWKQCFVQKLFGNQFKQYWCCMIVFIFCYCCSSFFNHIIFFDCVYARSWVATTKKHGTYMMILYNKNHNPVFQFLSSSLRSSLLKSMVFHFSTFVVQTQFSESHNAWAPINVRDGKSDFTFVNPLTTSILCIPILHN